MLTDDLRPKAWDKVVGQDACVMVLKAIINQPESAPRVLIFHGPPGTGKTSCARLFSKYLNYTDKDNDPSDDNGYQEFDMSCFATEKETMALLDQILPLAGKWKVIILDEFHRVTANAQSHYLKQFEDITDKFFYILCTTDVDRIIDPIRSRGLELNFTGVNRDRLISHLIEVAASLNIKVSPQTIKTIAARTRGQVRDAHMQLDHCRLVGEEEYVNANKSMQDLLCKFFISANKRDRNTAKAILNDISTIPVVVAKTEWEEFIWSVVDSVSDTKTEDSLMIELIKVYGENIGFLIKLYFSDLFQHVFRSERDFQAGMMHLFNQLEKI